MILAVKTVADLVGPKNAKPPCFRRICLRWPCYIRRLSYSLLVGCTGKTGYCPVAPITEQRRRSSGLVSSVIASVFVNALEPYRLTPTLVNGNRMCGHAVAGHFKTEQRTNRTGNRQHRLSTDGEFAVSRPAGN